MDSDGGEYRSRKSNMTTAVAQSRAAWQPLTPRGVTAFAHAPLQRLLLVQLVVAVLTAAAAAWFLDTAWFPTVRAAIQRLPPQAEIRAGRLIGTDGRSQLLAGGGFLAFAVDLEHNGEMRSPADVQVEFGRNDVHVISLAGYAGFDYPHDWIIAFNRTEVEPWWGAWGPPILWTTAAVVVIGLLAVWALLATIYLLPAWLVGLYVNRDLNLRASWKLAAAALLPGALLMAAAIFCYGLGLLDLVQLVSLASAHLVIGWIYVLVCPFFAPKLVSPAVAKGNPFTVPAPETGSPGGKENRDESPPAGS
jgi:hypothetical protein